MRNIVLEFAENQKKKPDPFKKKTAVTNNFACKQN